ncbi:PREDICTED: WD repeat-containing protein 31-like [Priapulus caudatus]|uniref:WD repeat-containing protein 31-like n=1 Tax=Priapulus caudatus TaxID=37621 RepID=A0ABM1E3A5_PRICU|nr:PREDICTED: WD repeat-containing protein 31-like [Priapulus caudatus]
MSVRLIWEDYSCRVTSVCWAPDDSVIAQTSEDKELRLWDPRSFNVVHVFPKKQNILSCCAVSEDGLHCLSGSSGCNSTGSELTLWDLRQRKPLCEFRGHEQGVSGCVFLPVNHGGQQMVASCGADSTVRVWNVESKDCVGLFMLEGRGPVTGIAAYPDYSILASTFNQGIHLLSLDYTNSHYPQLKRKLQF